MNWKQALHVVPTRENHATEGWPEKPCDCPYRVEFVDGKDGLARPLIIHERKDN